MLEPFTFQLFRFGGSSKFRITKGAGNNARAALG